MSRVLDCYTEKYAWKCCRSSENYTVNVRKFGYNVRKHINIYNSLRLVNEQTVYLNEKNAATLKIGCSPEHFFEVVARIESKTKNSVILTSNELIELVEFLENHLYDNEACKSAEGESTYQLATTSKKYIIDLKPIELRTFSMRIGRKYLTIDEESLNAILWKKSYIEHFLSLLEGTRKTCESVLFNLMTHFCCENNTLKLATDASRSKYYIRQFFNEILNYHCGCFDRTSIVIEIGANFSEWFSLCVPTFVKTIMLNEIDRLESFSSREWPHDKKHINVKKMAKCGLYYIGERDLVGCAFCEIQLHDWKLGDNPVLDHHKYSPNCKFLIEPKQCFNIPIGSEKKVEKLLSVLPTEKSYDVVD